MPGNFQVCEKKALRIVLNKITQFWNWTIFSTWHRTSYRIWKVEFTSPIAVSPKIFKNCLCDIITQGHPTRTVLTAMCRQHRWHVATCSFQPTVNRDKGIIMEPRIKLVILLPPTLQGLSYYVPKVGPPTPTLQERAIFGLMFHT